MEYILSIVVSCLSLAGIGVIDVALFRQLTADYHSLLRQNERSVFARGLTAILFTVLAVTLLITVMRNTPSEEPVHRGALLLSALVVLLIVLAFAIGYGALAWRLGERVLQVFGIAEPLPGWSVLAGSLLIVIVVWVPILGWALGLYWLTLAVGVVIQRLFGGATLEPKPAPLQGNPEEPV